MTFKTQLASAIMLGLMGLSAQAGELTIESWRVDDKALWEEHIIPTFNKTHPDIKIKFAPTAPTEYNASLNTRLSGGTAGDLITCRPFDISLELFTKGQLTDLSQLEGIKNFSDVAKSAWQTDDGKATFCMPMASVIHGFFYNQDIFKELELAVPNTEEEFFAVLEKLKGSKYTPIALGTNDGWETHQTVYTNIGPNYWKGEEGRKQLVEKKAKLTDPQFVAPYTQMAKWSAYMGNGYQSQTYGDSQNLFALGRAAIYPGGSWDIAYFNTNAEGMKYGAFKPPVAKAGDKCYISDHTDIGMGINPASKNVKEAETFLNWLASAEFAELYTNKVSGFFSLSNHSINVTDPVAAEMVSWRKQCDSTIRLNAQVLNRGKDDLETAFWNAGQAVVNVTAKPEEAAAKVQAILDK